MGQERLGMAATSRRGHTYYLSNDASMCTLMVRKVCREPSELLRGSPGAHAYDQV